MEKYVDDGQNGLAVLASANELRTDKVLVDVVLVVNGERLEPCHKFMLASYSPYFRAMFTHGMIEQEKTEIEIKGVEQQSLEAIIAYMYTGKVSITDENAQGLLTTCSLLQMTGLYGKCREYMIRRLDITNCLSMYQFARVMCCVRLQNEAMRFISRKFVAAAATDHWYLLSKDELIDIISSDDLWITKEELVYEAALSWLVSDVQSRSVFVAEVLSHVRFTLISEEFIDKCILEESAILHHPNLQIQIETAKSYIAAKRLSSSAGEKIGDGSESGYPFFLLPVQGLDNEIKVPLNVKLRAGMDTKELLLFTNGRRTFAMNPNTNSEYYGCLDTAPQSRQANEESAVDGWSSEIPVMKNPEAYACSDGSVFVLGGLEIERTSPLTVRTKLYTLEENSLSWSACECMPSPRCMAAYGDGCGYLYVMGGKVLADGAVVSHVIKYSIAENQWSDSAPMPLALYGHASTSYDGKIFTSGGKTNEKTLVGNVYCLECHSDTWTTMESLSTPRFLHGMTIDIARNMMLVGGGSCDNGVLDSVEEFHFSKDRWNFGESFPGNRCAQYITEFGGEIHAVGGYITERTADGKFESREMHDIFVLDKRTNQWSRKTRRIRGKNSSPMACVRVRLHTSNIPRASLTAGLSS